MKKSALIRLTTGLFTKKHLILAPFHSKQQLEEGSRATCLASSL